MMKQIGWKEKIRDIIEASQESVKSHERLLKDLRDWYDATDKTIFAEEFLHLLLLPLTFKVKSSYVDNCLLFLAKFTVSTTPEDAAEADDAAGSDFEERETDDSGTYHFLSIVKFVISVLSSTNTVVRWRGCNFLGLLLSECADQKRSNALNETAWNQLVKTLTERCTDKAVRVRSNAISALAKLQQPLDANCPAIGAISFLMRYDPSPEIRSQCIRSASTTKPNIVRFVERCRDVSEIVRRTLYEEISKRGLFKYLTVEQRLVIIDRGLKDSSETVRKICGANVIRSWLAAVEYDLPELVRRLDLITSEKSCELVLETLFNQKDSSEFVDMLSTMTDKWESQDWVTAERVFCLRHFIRFITVPPKEAASKPQFDAEEVSEWTEKLLPSLFSLVEFIEKYITQEAEGDEMDLVDGMLQRNFTVRQFLELLILVEKTDIAGRNRLQKMVENVAPAISSCALPSLVQLHMDLHRDVERTIEWMADAISELTVVPTLTQNLGNLTVNVVELDELTFNGNQITNDNEDEKVAVDLFKSLTLLSEVLKLTEVKVLTTTLRSQYENLVVPAIQNEDPATRNLAFRCLGLSCLLDRTLARNHVNLFLQTLKVDVDAVRKTAVEVLFDLLLVFRDGLAEDTRPADVEHQGDEKEIKEPITQLVISELIEILDSDGAVLQDVVAAGVAKLRIYAPTLSPEQADD